MNKKLLVKKQGKYISDLTLTIPKSGIVTVGSDASATVELTDENIAPEQFVIVCEGEQMTLLCRVDNTQINGNTLSQGALHNLNLYDEIIVGDYALKLETAESAEKLLNTKPEEIPELIETIETPAVEKVKERVVETVSAQNEISFDPNKSLNDVLESLKSEEKFYFLIENGSEEHRRIYVEKEEMWLGWAATGECLISENPSDITVPRAQIRKDWSGVVLYPLKNKNVWLNKQILDEPHRLKNDDSLQLLSKDKYLPDVKTNIKFHEPNALLVLDSILPKELPPPVSLEKTKSSDLILDTQSSGRITAKNQLLSKSKSSKGRIFGYFTGLEILIMIIGIIVAASFIFLVLEYF